MLIICAAVKPLLYHIIDLGQVYRNAQQTQFCFIGERTCPAAVDKVVRLLVASKLGKSCPCVLLSIRERLTLLEIQTE